jgi:hypothetical protein
VHNDRVTGRLRVRALAALLVCAALGVSGCGGSGSSSPSVNPGTTGPTTPGQTQPGSATSSIPVPSGVTLTPEGTDLALGKAATVAWQPDQKTVGVIRMAVTRQEEVPISTFRAFRLDRATRRSTPYFVQVTVTNLGHSDLSHATVPLYLLNHHHTLLQASTFQAQFPACPSRPLPRGFDHGKRVKVCLVYFVPQHGTLVAMSFRPSQDYVAITWHGPVKKPVKKPARKPSKKPGKQQ